MTTGFMIAGFIGICVAFYLGAWARLRFKNLWIKLAFFFVAWVSGFLTAFIVVPWVEFVIMSFAGVLDIESARDAGRALGAKKTEFLVATGVAAIAGLVSSLGERIGIGRRLKSRD
jgi:hypothetical protein